MLGIAIGAGFLGGAILGPPLAFAVLGIWLAWRAWSSESIHVAGVVTVVIATGCGVWRGERFPESSYQIWLGQAESVRGLVVGAPSNDGARQRFFLQVDEIETGGAWQTLSARLYVSAPQGPEVRPGDRVWVPGTPTPVEDLSVGFGRYLATRHADGSLTARIVSIDRRGAGWRRVVFELNSRVEAVFSRAAPGDAGTLLAGLVTGRDDSLSDEARAAFVRTGTSHLTAVSGSNLALLVTFAMLAGRAQGIRRRIWWQLGVVAGISGYAMLVGFEPPVARAGLVAFGAIFASRFGRRADIVTLLVLGGALMVAIQPIVLWTPSFQLSLASSLALAIVVPEQSPRSFRTWIEVAAKGTLATQVATLPIQLAAFGQVPVLAVLANVLVLPLAALAFQLAMMAAVVGQVQPSVGEAIARTAALPARAVLAIVERLSELPFAVIPGHPGPVTLALLTVACASAIAVWSGRHPSPIPQTAAHTTGQFAVGKGKVPTETAPIV